MSETMRIEMTVNGTLRSVDVAVHHTLLDVLRDDVLTVEGLAEGGELSVLQEAFLDTGAAQCGFCISGQLMAAHALLESNPDPTVREVQEGMAGNLCRCAGYEQIAQAVLAAAKAGSQ